MNDLEADTWLVYARDDLVWARVSAQAGLFSRACFAAQQASEKALKAYLVRTTGMYPRIHELIELLELSRAHDSTLIDLKSNCDVLDQYYLTVRYPAVRSHDDFDQRESQTAISLAEQVLARVEAKIKGP